MRQGAVGKSKRGKNPSRLRVYGRGSDAINTGEEWHNQVVKYFPVKVGIED
jgi:hypothetical protein